MTAFLNPNNKEIVMSNVTALPIARQSIAGHQAHPEPVNPVAAIVSAIDKAIGDKWSIDILQHEVVGDETVILAKLIVDGKYRVAFGGTSEKGTLVERLNSAALDALTRAAEWMGIAVSEHEQFAIPAQQVQHGESSALSVVSTPDDQPTRLSRKQLDFIYSLARQQGIARDKVAERSLADFGRKAEFLSKQQASDFIKALQNSGGAR